MGSQPFDWPEYLKLAVELGSRDDEASLRTALSRAYYYVYHLALERAKANNFTFVEGGMHAQLWRVYSDSPDPECQRLGQLAARLKDKRQKADYEKKFVRIKEEVPGILSDAESFSARLLKLDKRLPNPNSQRR